jgi:hypothetical protein
VRYRIGAIDQHGVPQLTLDAFRTALPRMQYE